MLEKFKDVLTVRDLFEILPLGRSKIYELLRNGQIRHLRVGTKIIIPKQNVIDFLSYGGVLK